MSAPVLYQAALYCNKNTASLTGGPHIYGRYTKSVNRPQYSPVGSHAAKLHLAVLQLLNQLSCVTRLENHRPARLVVSKHLQATQARHTTIITIHSEPALPLRIVIRWCHTPANAE